MKSHVYFFDGQATCSVCGTGPEQISEGKSDNFKISLMRDLENPGKYDENLLGWAECKKCKRQTQNVCLPYLYY